MTMAADMAERLKQTDSTGADRAIRWAIALMGIVFFTLLYLLLSLPMVLCWSCESLFGRNRKQSGVN